MQQSIFSGNFSYSKREFVILVDYRVILILLNVQTLK